MRQLVLHEYELSPPISLSASQLAAAWAYTDAISVRGTPDVGHFQVKATSWVGVIELPGLTVRIQPKVDIRRVLFLMAYTADPTGWKDYSSLYGHDPLLLESIAEGLSAAIRRAVRTGLLFGYRRADESLQTVRGRIRFQEQISRRYGLMPPVDVAYDDFTDDIKENRIIRAALDRMHQLQIRSDRARTQLRIASSGFGTIMPVHYDSRRLPEFTYTRLNIHYRPAIELARLILKNTSIHDSAGGFESTAFLVDMEKLFEDFLVVALKEHRVHRGSRVIQGGKNLGLYLDDDRRIPLKPDISVWKGNSCTFLGDAKYKIPIDHASNSDLYQMLAYMTTLGMSESTLIYPGAQSGDTLNFSPGNRRVHMRFIDLHADPSEILAQVSRVLQTREPISVAGSIRQ